MSHNIWQYEVQYLFIFLKFWVFVGTAFPHCSHLPGLEFSKNCSFSAFLLQILSKKLNWESVAVSKCGPTRLLNFCSRFGSLPACLTLFLVPPTSLDPEGSLNLSYLVACACPIFACARLCLPVLACACLRLPALACACLCSPVLACACLCLPVPCLPWLPDAFPMLARARPCLPVLARCSPDARPCSPDARLMLARCPPVLTYAWLSYRIWSCPALALALAILIMP